RCAFVGRVGRAATVSRPRWAARGVSTRPLVPRGLLDRRGGSFLAGYSTAERSPSIAIRWSSSERQRACRDPSTGPAFSAQARRWPALSTGDLPGGPVGRGRSLASPTTDPGQPGPTQREPMSSRMIWIVAALLAVVGA